jgi:hypothetical protein
VGQTTHLGMPLGQSGRPGPLQLTLKVRRSLAALYSWQLHKMGWVTFSRRLSLGFRTTIERKLHIDPSSPARIGQSLLHHLSSDAPMKMAYGTYPTSQKRGIMHNPFALMTN